MSDITLEADVDLTNIKTEDLIKVLKFRKYKPEDLIVQEDEKELLKQIKEICRAGAIGMAIGRNVWQSPDPLTLTKKMKEVIFQ